MRFVDLSMPLDDVVPVDPPFLRPKIEYKDHIAGRKDMEAMYGMNGQARDAITDYSTPASGSYYFAPSADALDAMLA